MYAFYSMLYNQLSNNYELGDLIDQINQHFYKWWWYLAGVINRCVVIPKFGIDW